MTTQAEMNNILNAATAGIRIPRECDGYTPRPVTASVKPGYCGMIGCEATHTLTPVTVVSASSTIWHGEHHGLTWLYAPYMVDALAVPSVNMVKRVCKGHGFSGACEPGTVCANNPTVDRALIGYVGDNAARVELNGERTRVMGTGAWTASVRPLVAVSESIPWCGTTY